MSSFLNKIFGSRNDRVLKKLRKTVTQIAKLETEVEALDDAALKEKTQYFREQLKQGKTITDILPEAFSVVREAGKRALGMRHFDVQLIGAMVLNDGKIAEMRTGEGKTLVATLAVYLNALAGKGVHVVTVNDYLAQRDADQMSQLYSFLGLTTGVIIAGLSNDERRQAYASDITYGTNNEFGFDYLRDNMVFSAEEKVQRELHFAVIDEVDSILIDEARTPLIISGPAEDSADVYQQINTLIPHLTRQEEKEEEVIVAGDYTVDEKNKQVHFTEAGHEKIENLLTEIDLLAENASLYDAANIGLMHHVSAALRAHVLFQRDVDYIVQDNQIVIVDEFTGRTMEGRRWSEGLHQAIEAKEAVSVQNENQTLASITYQNYFRLYNKLSGMTGTADTEAFELHSIYGLEVVVIPTNLPMVRKDEADRIYLTTQEKYQAILEDIQGCVQRKQPVLVGTASIESSEYLSELLKKAKIQHEVLNAKFHEKEAHIVASAGAPGSITIATNMAGRGTDIVLGGSLEVALQALPDNADDSKKSQVRADWKVKHDEVIAAGGLYIIGTERNESRRVDNQLRGRSGRQGDPGASRFYLSLEDNLMRIFASDRMAGMMQKLGMEKGEAIEHVWVSKAIGNAQRKVEGHNFDIRKQLLEFDDVANEQRKVIYDQRNELMTTDDVSQSIVSMRETVLNETISMYIPENSIDEQWDITALEEAFRSEFGLDLDVRGWLDSDEELDEQGIRERILAETVKTYDEKEQHVGAETMRYFEKAVTLQTLDSQWKEHLSQMDYLRAGINLRGYAQKDPKQEYKRESFNLFTAMLDNIKGEVIRDLSRVQIGAPEDVEAVDEQRRQTPDELEYQHDDVSAMQIESTEEQPEESTQPYIRDGMKVGRNDLCPCGSGKKYKHCHGALS